jgi:hypothetical protein
MRRSARVYRLSRPARAHGDILSRSPPPRDRQPPLPRPAVRIRRVARWGCCSPARRSAAIHVRRNRVLRAPSGSGDSDRRVGAVTQRRSHSRLAILAGRVLDECYDPARHKPGGAQRLARTRHFDDLADPATRRDLNAAPSSRGDDLVGPRTVVCDTNDLDTIALHGRERTASFEAGPVLRLGGAPPCDARPAVALGEQRLMLGSGVASRRRRQCGRYGSLALLPQSIS